jgi:Tfp pilus assembly protein PilF
MDLQIQTDPADSSASPWLPLALRSRREVRLLLVLALVLVTLAVYEPSLQNGFINYDDPDYITANVHVRSGLSWNNVVWAFTTMEQANWHPLTWISLMASAEFFGAKPMGYHLVNLLLHTLNVVLLFLLLQEATGYMLRSGVVAALFAVFPLNVEAVAWATERKSVLSTAFLFFTLLAYGSYARRPGVLHYLTVMLLFAFGLMTKAWFVTLPFALLLLDYWPLKRIGIPERKTGGMDFFAPRLLKLVAEKIPLLVMSAGSLLITLYAGYRGGALSSPTTRAPLGLRAENALWSYLVYMLRGIWPSHLAIIYPFPDKPLPLWKVATAGMILLAITVAVCHNRQRGYLLAGWLWFLGILFPLIGIVQSGPQSMADRWAYISFLGLFVMAVWLVAEFAAHIRFPRPAVAAITFAVLFGYAWVSHIQISYWRSSYTLFSHALQVTTRNGYAENNLGTALEQEMERPDLAIQHYEAAVRITPQLPTAHYNLGVLLQRQHRFDEALREYKLALAYAWTPFEATLVHNNLGSLFVERNQPMAALSEFGAAIRIDPTNDYSFLNRAMLEYQEKNFDAAQEDFFRATQLMPTAGTYYWLGRALADKGDLRSAASAYQTAVSMNPSFADVEARLEEVRRQIQR